MTFERVDSRILAALRVVDAETGSIVSRRLSVSAPGVSVTRNASWLYVITRAPGFDVYTSTFEQASAAAAAPITLVVSDPELRYIPIRHTLSLPRSTAPDAADSVFRPVDVPLFPSPSAVVNTGSAIVRARITDAASGAGLAGALLRVISDGDDVLARGLTDTRGEGIVAVPGIRVTSWSDGQGSVLLTEIDASIEAAYDPAPNGASGAVPAPVTLEENLAGLRRSSITKKLASRREVRVSLSIATSP
ncbi:hypothetical protein [Sorangium sp. So ce388]|uniref:hypothetical protein n=1 Tax=Sorangium sp. So ce388 TaxID=3133309 RepID=UPI003F5C02AC